MKMNKKAFLDPFDISGRIGYYILAILMISILFMFLAVLLQTSEVNYFKSNYGTAVINIEERAFNLIEFVDPITNQKYTKVIDLVKFEELRGVEDCTSKFNKGMGVKTEYDRKGIKIELIYDGIIKELKTCNYIEGRHDIEKHFPVLYNVGDEFRYAEVRMYFWKP